MSGEIKTSGEKEFKKAKDLKMSVRYEFDRSEEGTLRVKQAKDIICQLILLGQKRGRPAKAQENLDEAA